jgi:hypothetical protein
MAMPQAGQKRTARSWRCARSSKAHSPVVALCALKQSAQPDPGVVRAQAKRTGRRAASNARHGIKQPRNSGDLAAPGESVVREFLQYGGPASNAGIPTQYKAWPRINRGGVSAESSSS